MVNCATCKKTFKTRIGKGKNSRCESCAQLWRELQLKEDSEGRKERQRELDIMERELELKQRQLEMEKQKVTIKECFPNGGNVELTCYYDDSMQEKVRNLLKGAYLALPSSSTSGNREAATENYPRNYSTKQKQRDYTRDIDDTLNYKRVHFEPASSRLSDLRNISLQEETEFPDHRRPRKLPSVDALKSRLTSRHRLEDEGSSFGSGGSAE